MKNTPYIQLSYFFCCLCFLLLCCHTPSTTLSKHEQTEADSKACIERVLKADNKLGTIRNHACETISLSETIRNYTKGMKALSYKGCKEVFATAFEKHREAWDVMIPVTDHFPELRGEMHDLFKIMEEGEHAEEFKSRLKVIWDTWAEVEAAWKE